MANREACELFIEQEIKDALAQGKKPYSIGKELSAWVEKLFETNIPADTLRKRAERIGTNVHSQSTNENSLEITDNQVSNPEPQPKHGGARKGAGAPQKYEFTNAIEIATFVISHLERIGRQDPKREEALQKVINWITNHWED